MGYPVQQSTTTQNLVFKMYLTGTLTPATGKTVTGILSKNGASFGAASGTVSEIGNGYYMIAANTTDNNTLGPLALYATASGCDATDDVFMVVLYNPLNANLGLTNLDAAITSRMASYTQPTGFLAATFPTTVASTTNITGGTITTVANLTNLPAITSNWLTAAGLATDAVAEIADAVWDELLSGHVTVGSAGLALTAAGAAGDPWSSTLPGSYTVGQAGYIFGHLTTAELTILAPVISSDGAFDIVRGDSYYAANSRAISISYGATPVLSDASVYLRIKSFPTPVSIAGSVTGDGTATQIVTFELSPTITAALEVGDHDYDIDATLADDNPVTLGQGVITVLAQVE